MIWRILHTYSNSQTGCKILRYVLELPFLSYKIISRTYFSKIYKNLIFIYKENIVICHLYLEQIKYKLGRGEHNKPHQRKNKKMRQWPVNELLYYEGGYEFYVTLLLQELNWKSAVSHYLISLVFVHEGYCFLFS